MKYLQFLPFETPSRRYSATLKDSKIFWEIQMLHLFFTCCRNHRYAGKNLELDLEFPASKIDILIRQCCYFIIGQLYLGFFSLILHVSTSDYFSSPSIWTKNVIISFIIQNTKIWNQHQPTNLTPRESMTCVSCLTWLSVFFR